MTRFAPKLKTGVNDLQALFPELAAEADGWDPSEVYKGSGKKLLWKCPVGHPSYEATPGNRTRVGSGCPYCSGRLPIIGETDLKSVSPALAQEADGWDPEQCTFSSGKKRQWRCSKGHTYMASPDNRQKGKGCPYCSHKSCLPGFNDLKTTHPQLAAEAEGWDPGLFIGDAGLLKATGKRARWRGRCGHFFEASIANRKKGKGCPYCAGQKLLVGFNDLRTRAPSVAAEADGWDPSQVFFQSTEKRNWKCSKGHTWTTRVDVRTYVECGCPSCQEYGFNPSKPAWLYLMERPGEQQFGITNHLEQRIRQHDAFGWILLDKIGPYDGDLVLRTEVALKRWLKKEVGVIKGKRENWESQRMSLHSIRELFDRAQLHNKLRLDVLR